MMIHMNCRGYAVAQFMQPEPAKYSHAPNLEAKTFMQPEQPYYAHHPGRFVYVKDEVSGGVFSAPYEPVRKQADKYVFSIGKHDLRWQVVSGDIEVEMVLTLPKAEAMELWSVKVKNLSSTTRKLSVYPYFTVGYMSWMNQSGEYAESLQGIVCSSVTPYQKYQDYDKIKTFADKTFLLADERPVAWEVNQEAFEGEGDSMPRPLLRPTRWLAETQDMRRRHVPYSIDWNSKPGQRRRIVSSLAPPTMNRRLGRFVRSTLWM